MYSLISAEEILSMSEHPYCSGMSTLAMPISHAFRISSRVTAKSLCSIFSVLGRISFFANSSVVRTICLCSSVRSSGVNTWSVVCSSIKKLPPTNLVLLGTATVAILSLLFFYREGSFFLESRTCRSLQVRDPYSNEALSVQPLSQCKMIWISPHRQARGRDFRKSVLCGEELIECFR